MAFEAITREDGSVRYTFDTNDGFELPAWPEGMEKTECANWIESCAKQYGAYLDERSQVVSDKRLSQFGQVEQLESRSGSLVESIAKLQAAIDGYSEDLDLKESVLLSVPELDATHAAQAAIDIEVRQWWRSMTGSERTKYLGLLQQQNQSYGRVRLALLRSPVALLDHELQSVRASWDAQKRLDRPEDFEAIDAARKTLEIARRAMGHLAGKTMTRVKWDQDKIARHLLSSSNDYARRGYKAFGIDEVTAAKTRRLIEARKLERQFG